MEVQEAKKENIPEIVGLWNEFMHEHEKYLTGNNPLLKEFETMDKNMNEIYTEYITPYVESDNGKVFFVEDEGRMIGFAFIIIKEDIPLFLRKNIGFISDLYVKKEYRSKKISSKLLEKSYGWFKSKGLEVVSLTTYIDNKLARNVYKKFGFMDYKIELRKLL